MVTMLETSPSYSRGSWGCTKVRTHSKVVWLGSGKAAWWDWSPPRGALSTWVQMTHICPQCAGSVFSWELCSYRGVRENWCVYKIKSFLFNQMDLLIYLFSLGWNAKGLHAEPSVLKLSLHAPSSVWFIAGEIFLPLCFQLVVFNILESYSFFSI